MAVRTKHKEFPNQESMPRGWGDIDNVGMTRVTNTSSISALYPCFRPNVALLGDSALLLGIVPGFLLSSEPCLLTTATPGNAGKCFLFVLAEHRIVPAKLSSAEKKRKAWMFCGRPVVSVPLYFHFWKMWGL